MRHKPISVENPILHCDYCQGEVDLRNYLSPTEIEEGLRKLYHESLFVQNAFPTLPSGVREMFVTRICETCFDAMFEEE